MYSDLFYSFTISFLGAILFLLVDKYEPEGALAGLLKFLVRSRLAWPSCTNCSHTDLRCSSRSAPSSLCANMVLNRNQRMTDKAFVDATPSPPPAMSGNQLICRPHCSGSIRATASVLPAAAPSFAARAAANCGLLAWRSWRSPLTRSTYRISAPSSVQRVARPADGQRARC